MYILYVYTFPSYKFQNEDILNETEEAMVEGTTKTSKHEDIHLSLYINIPYPLRSVA